MSAEQRSGKVTQSERISIVEQSLSSNNQRLSSLEAQLQSIGEHVTKQTASTEEKFKAWDQSLDQKLDAQARRFAALVAGSTARQEVDTGEGTRIGEGPGRRSGLDQRPGGTGNMQSPARPTGGSGSPQRTAGPQTPGTTARLRTSASPTRPIRELQTRNIKIVSDSQEFRVKLRHFDGSKED